MAVKAEFKPVTELQVGERTAGGTVTGIRYSKSGKTIFLTLRGKDGSETEWPGQPSCTRSAVYTEA